MNPLAHFRHEQTVDDVLNSRMIVSPLTLPMCAPMTDGAAALLLCSASYAKRLDTRPIRVLTSHLAASPGSGGSPVGRAARAAYEATGIGPDGLDLIELHVPPRLPNCSSIPRSAFAGRVMPTAWFTAA